MDKEGGEAMDAEDRRPAPKRQAGGGQLRRKL